MVSSGAIMPARAPPSIDMLHTVMRPSMDRPVTAEPRYSITWPLPPPVPMRPITRQDQVLGGDAGRQVAVDGDGHGGRASLGERLGGQHVLDLAGADPEGEGTERPVGRGVAVAADDGHAGLGQPLLGSDDVDDALVGVAHRVAGDAELGAVGVEDRQLLGRDGVGHRLVDVGGRHVVVGGGDGEVGAVHAPTGQAQPVEGLGRGDLVDQVEVDEEDVRLLRAPGADDVAVPDLLRQCAGLGHGGQAPISTISTRRLPRGAAYSTVSPTAWPSSACPSGRPGRHHGEVALALLDGPDEVVRRVVRVVALVAEGDDGAVGDRAVGRAAAFDDGGLLEHLLELADPRLHLPLAVLGGVVVAVLLQVAEGPCRLDEGGDLDAAARGEVLELGLEALVGVTCQLGVGGVAHGVPG